MHTVFWSENLKGRYHAEDLVVDAKIILDPAEAGNSSFRRRVQIGSGVHPVLCPAGCTEVSFSRGRAAGV